MKHLQSSLAAKITAIILLAALTLTFLASGVGIAYLAYHGAYTDSGQSVLRDSLENLLQRDTDELICNIEGVGDIQNSTLSLSLDPLVTIYAPDDTNFRFTVTDSRGNLIVSNGTAEKTLAEQTTSESFSYLATSTVETLQFDNEGELWQYYNSLEYDTQELSSDRYVCSYESGIEIDEENNLYSITVYHDYYRVFQLNVHTSVDAGLTANDDYSTAYHWLSRLVQLRSGLIVICLISLVLALVLFVFLLCSAGHKAGVDGIYLNWANRIPFDLYALILIALAFLPAALINYYYWRLIFLLPSFAAACLCWLLLLTALILSFAARAKAGKWWRNTLIFRLLRFCKRFVLWLAHAICRVCACMPLIWKGCLAWAGLCLVELIISIAAPGFVLWLLQFLLLTPLLILVLINLRTLEKGGEELAGGNLNYKTDLRNMLPSFRRHGEALNHISDGMQKAVDKQMRSERMKTELITNVSHDIKTPLTSIVTYVDLLKKPGNSEAQTAEYLDVLDRQSARLKRLTEDLVEASKASTGNLPVNLELTDVNVLLSQAAGEYAEKLAAHRLELVSRLCPSNPVILADGRLLWRVFDNLLGNIRKYALEGTRVYLSSQIEHGTVTVTFRNISKDPLNISSDELMERFVRGDTSRNTEGSGLGLSIARSLIQLQHGVFDIAIDGDLFKAVISFPIAAAQPKDGAAAQDGEL